MYKPYQKPVAVISADVNVSPPSISAFFIFILSILSKIYIKMLFGFAKIVLKGDDILFDTFKNALNKQNRCIIAFRHPDGREPQLLAWFFLFKLRALARKKKVRFNRRPHSIFVYGYEVVRWGGWAARLFMPKLGAIPIHHTKLDSKGMARIYGAVMDGPFPVSLAPEGQVSYSTDTVPRLEHGTVRIGFSAANQLADKNEKAPVVILPISIHFRYDNWGKKAMFKLLTKIEKLCSFNVKETKKLEYQQRLKNCMEYILKVNEDRYFIQTNSSLSLEDRLKKIIEAALEKAQSILGIEAQGDFFARLYNVRHVFWDRIFVPGLDKKGLNQISSIKRCVMDLNAGEAWYASRHQELADFGWYFTRPLPNLETALHQQVEYVQNLFDFANRTMGGAISGRINIQPNKVIIKAAPVINLTQKLPLYKENKKTVIAGTVLELEQKYLDCIKEINNDY